MPARAGGARVESARSVGARVRVERPTRTLDYGCRVGVERPGTGDEGAHADRLIHGLNSIGRRLSCLKSWTDGATREQGRHGAVADVACAQHDGAEGEQHSCVSCQCLVAVVGCGFFFLKVRRLTRREGLDDFSLVVRSRADSRMLWQVLNRAVHQSSHKKTGVVEQRHSERTKPIGHITPVGTAAVKVRTKKVNRPVRKCIVASETCIFCARLGQ